jgi:retron-type reverse transcriptase
VTELLDLGEPVDIVFFDFKKAFDTVPHQRLLYKAEKCGISGNLLRWIKEWLSERRQRVVVNGSFSDWIQVISGVPQGSVLGPILFLIYINDLGDGVKEFLSLFADDTKLFSSVRSAEQVQSLQDSINKLNSWSEEWLMQFNASKCAVMHLGSNNPCHNYTLGSATLETTKSEKDVGVIVQDNCKFGEQC